MLDIGSVVTPYLSYQCDVAGCRIESGLHERRRIQKFFVTFINIVAERDGIFHEAHPRKRHYTSHFLGCNITQRLQAAIHGHFQEPPHTAPQIGIGYHRFIVRFGRGQRQRRRTGYITWLLRNYHQLAHTLENINDTQLPLKPNAEDMA